MAEQFNFHVPTAGGLFQKKKLTSSDFTQILENIASSTISGRSIHISMINDFAKLADPDENKAALRANPHSRAELLKFMDFVLETEKTALERGEPGHSPDKYAVAKRITEEVRGALTPQTKLNMQTDDRGRVSVSYTDDAGKTHNLGSLRTPRGVTLDLTSAEIAVDGQTIKQGGVNGAMPGRNGRY